MGGNSHIKETQAAKRFANEIGIYGIRFLCFYKDWCVFGTTLPPGVLATWHGRRSISSLRKTCL